jgi:hypothetical protein
MKHLLNNLTEEEKNSIRNQHTGGMNVVTENFSKLINAKSGEVKPLISEQETKGEEDTTPYVDPMFGNAGYQKVDEVNLSDGEYIGNLTPEVYKLPDWANLKYVRNIFLFTKDKKYTGYILELPIASRSGVQNLPVTITGKRATIENPEIVFQYFYKQPTSQSGATVNEQVDNANVKTITNKVASEGIKNVTPEMISSPQFKGQYSGYVFGGVFNGVNYEWDCNDVPGMSGVRGVVQGEIISEISKNMFSAIKKYPGDNNPESPCVGFYSKSGSSFIIYSTSNGTVKCMYF